MKPPTDKNLHDVKAALLEGMREFMEDADGAYEDADVRRCGEVLDRFAAAISAAVDRQDALAHVRATVLELNALNAGCEGILIETDQREMICEFILETVARRGFISSGDDVTLEWREW